MAISAYTTEGTAAVGERRTTDYVIDSASDVASLPTDTDVIAPGSTAITPGGDVYILFPSGNWQKM